MKARLHSIWAGCRAGYLYSVIFNGELVDERSRDPECDLARALLAKGITGAVTLCDGKSGKPRMIVNIEKAAKLCVEETGNVPRLRRWRGGVVKAPAPKRGPPMGRQPEALTGLDRRKRKYELAKAA